MPKKKPIDKIIEDQTSLKPPKQILPQGPLPTGPSDRQSSGFRVSKAIQKKLKVVAAIEGRKIGSMVEDALLQYIAELEKARGGEKYPDPR